MFRPYIYIIYLTVRFIPASWLQAVFEKGRKNQCHFLMIQFIEKQLFIIRF